MFKNLQATIFCFAAVILAIILISSSCSDSKKRKELNGQLETFRQQHEALTQETEAVRKELEATKAEAKLLSDQVKQESTRSQTYLKKMESLVAVNQNQKDQLETAKKQIADIQNKLLVARQIANSAANPQEVKKLEDEVKKLEAEIKTLKADLNNKDIQLKVIMPQSRKLAAELLETRKKLEEKNAKASAPSKPKTK